MKKYYLIIVVAFSLLGIAGETQAACRMTGDCSCHNNSKGAKCCYWKCDDGTSGHSCTNNSPWQSSMPASGHNSPPPPPPQNGRCHHDIDGKALFEKPGSSLCSDGGPSAVTGDGSTASPWTWTCSGSNGGSRSGPCTATQAGPVSCTVNPACPTSRNINETVTWSANVSGGFGTFSYLWSGDGFVNGKNTQSVSGTYTTSIPRFKNAAVTVKDVLNNSRSVNCPTSCGGSGSNGGTSRIGKGIEITNNGVCSAVYVGQIDAYPDSSQLCANGNPADLLKIYPDNNWTEPVRWTWKCLGADKTAGDIDASCEVSLNPEDTQTRSLDCSISLVDPVTTLNQIRVNTNSKWLASSTYPGAVSWKVMDNNGETFLDESSVNLTHIFSTVGLKTIYAKVSSSTIGVWGVPCTATTSVVYQGGGINEI